MKNFLLTILNGQPPTVEIDGLLMHIVSCDYKWSTRIDHDTDISYAIVSGYFEGNGQLRTFNLNFKTEEAFELDNPLPPAPSFWDD